MKLSNKPKGWWSLNYETRAEYLRVWRISRIELSREQERLKARKRRRLKPMVVREEDRLKHRKRRTKERIYAREYAKNHKKDPIKYKARTILNNAIKMGRIVRPTKCERCENLKPQAHHSDYSKPLEVIWLCSRCHALEHHPIPLSDVQELINKLDK